MVNDRELINSAKFHVSQKKFVLEAECLEKVTTEGPPKSFTLQSTDLTSATAPTIELWREGDYANKQVLTGAELSIREDTSVTPSRWFVKFTQAPANASPFTSEGKWFYRPIVTIATEIIIYEPIEMIVGI